MPYATSINHTFSMTPNYISDKSKVNTIPAENESEFIETSFDISTNNFERPESQIKKLVLPTNEGLEFVKIDDIVRCESDSNYTKVYLLNETQIFLAKTLKEFENLLLDHGFIRVHNSHLISEKFIAKYFKADGGSIQMDDGSIIPLSRKRKIDFLDRYKLV